MSTRSRSELSAEIRTAFLSHTFTVMSPPKLLRSSRAPRVTATVVSTLAWYRSSSPPSTFTTTFGGRTWRTRGAGLRSEEHTSELQSHVNLVCRLLLEKKKNNKKAQHQEK